MKTKDMILLILLIVFTCVVMSILVMRAKDSDKITRDYESTMNSVNGASSFQE